jgi:hypothetical protein
MPDNQTLTLPLPTTGTVSASLDVSVKTDNSILPATCSAVANAVRSAGSLNSFLTTYKLNTGDAAQIPGNLTRFQEALAQASQTTAANLDANATPYQQINTYLDETLFTQMLYARFAAQCLEDVGKASHKELEDQKAATEESKQRLESITSPENHVSYYEGWFPLFRPMTETTLFILFGTALFLFMVSTYLFLRMGGMEFEVRGPTFMLPDWLGGEGGGFPTKLVGGAIVVGGVIGYAGYRLGWFEQ